MDKRSFTTALAKYGFNPLVRGLLRLGIRPPGTALLETTGRKSGKSRRTPVTDGLDGDTFWIVTEHGHRAGYVRNIQANPHVCVKVAGRWRSGTAHLLEDDDPRQRLRYIGSRRLWSRLNAATVLLMQTELLTIRVDSIQRERKPTGEREMANRYRRARDSKPGTVVVVGVAGSHPRRMWRI